MDLANITEIVTPILRRYGVKRAAVFGSAARGEAGADSDVDLLIELDEPLGLLKLAQLNYVLEDALQKKVDLVKILPSNRPLKIVFCVTRYTFIPLEISCPNLNRGGVKIPQFPT
ncbi:MAG: nucleotidyltransferase family protein [Candidatus Liptonbacteria bacterium]|nr:nucleotidyltransferase family protein [Candidatus Liptonbacteria bacterium]